MKDYQFNDYEPVNRADRRHKWVAFCVGVAGFAGVIGLVFWFMFQLAKGVAGR